MGAPVTDNLEVHKYPRDVQDRGQWSRQLDFILSLVGYAVGLGNLWRFPYLCMRNGGGAFLIPYFLFLFLCGIPLFFLELTIGQFSGLSPFLVWKISPLFKGLGYSMVIVSTLITMNYNIVFAWIVYFLISSFTSQLPWTSCGHDWNTPQCFQVESANFTGAQNFTLNSSRLPSLSYTYPFNSTTANRTGLLTYILKNLTRTPSEEFWEYNVLSRSAGIHDLGSMKWQLVLCMIGALFLIFCCLFKGVKSLGKVVYVTATFPYILLTILLIRSCLLPGALDGIKFYITPRFHSLTNIKIWGEAALQIFYSLGPGWGGLITMASYNKFNNNCYRDSILVPLVTGGSSFYAGFVIFSIIGFLAKEVGLPVSEVITSGPGLAFVAYPSALGRLPISPLWAILFFLMLLTVGLDSQFGMVETLISSVEDQFPVLHKRKTFVVAGVCAVMVLLALPLTTQGGVYIFQLMDWYCAFFSIVVIAFLECIVVSYIYGVNRLYKDIEMMIGYKPCIWWKISWCFVTPLILLGLLIFSVAGYTPPTYGDYIYPGWAVSIGWFLATVSVIPIPVCMVAQMLSVKGSFMTRLKTSIMPNADWRPRDGMYDVCEVEDTKSQNFQLSVRVD